MASAFSVLARRARLGLHKTDAFVQWDGIEFRQPTSYTIIRKSVNNGLTKTSNQIWKCRSDASGARATHPVHVGQNTLVCCCCVVKLLFCVLFWKSAKLRLMTRAPPPLCRLHVIDQHHVISTAPHNKFCADVVIDYEPSLEPCQRSDRRSWHELVLTMATTNKLMLAATGSMSSDGHFHCALFMEKAFFFLCLAGV